MEGCGITPARSQAGSGRETPPQTRSVDSTPFCVGSDTSGDIRVCPVYQMCVVVGGYDVMMMSSIQVVGHMFAFPLIHDLVASTAEERTQARELVDDIIGR